MPAHVVFAVEFLAAFYAVFDIIGQMGTNKRSNLLPKRLHIFAKGNIHEGLLLFVCSNRRFMIVHVSRRFDSRNPIFACRIKRG